MSHKRPLDKERDHLLRKIRRLERRVYALPDSDDEENSEDVSKENKTPVDDEDHLIEGFISSEEDKVEDNIDEEVLDILGTPNQKPKKESLRKEIADRWTEILEKGLKKEEKEEIVKENQPYENCPKMVAPKLNKEVSVALSESARKRDTLIESRQKQMSTSLSCLGHAMQLCIGGDMQNKKLEIIKKINEASRLLCDALYLDSRGRRTLVLSTINKNLKDSLQETEPAEYLFGDNLADKIKTAKAVQKSGKDLKTPVNDEKKKKKPETDKKKSLNWRGPPQSNQSNRKPGGPVYNQHRKKYEKRPQKQ